MTIIRTKITGTQDGGNVIFDLNTMCPFPLNIVSFIRNGKDCDEVTEWNISAGILTAFDAVTTDSFKIIYY